MPREWRWTRHGQPIKRGELAGGTDNRMWHALRQGRVWEATKGRRSNCFNQEVRVLPQQWLSSWNVQDDFIKRRTALHASQEKSHMQKQVSNRRTLESPALYAGLPKPETNTVCLPGRPISQGQKENLTGKVIFMAFKKYQEQRDME